MSPVIECKQLGDVRATRHLADGTAVEIHHCRQFRSCVLDAAQAYSLGMHGCSSSCTGFAARIGEGTYLTCPHRGEPLRQVKSTCNIDKNIYQCALKGECLKRLPTGKTRQSFADELVGVTICKSCDVFEPAQPPQPSEPPDLSPLPAKFTGELVKHFIFHVWPYGGNGAWQWNCGEARKYIEQFNGKRIIGIATGHGAASADEVKAAFAGVHIDEFIVRTNNPMTGEGETFFPMLDRLPRGPNDVTFYGHAKGVRGLSCKQDPEATEFKTAIKLWCETMYDHCLGDMAAVAGALSEFPTCGCFKQTYHDPRKTFPHHHWHFAGTFFWFRNADAFALPNWNRAYGGYYCVENWPGQLFPSNQAKCLFAECVPMPHFFNLYDDVALNELINMSANEARTARP